MDVPVRMQSKMLFQKLPFISKKAWENRHYFGRPLALYLNNAPLKAGNKGGSLSGRRLTP